MSHLIHMESNYRGVRWYNRQRDVDRQMIRCSVYYRHLWGRDFPPKLTISNQTAAKLCALIFFSGH